MAALAITTSDPASRIFWQHCAPDIVTGDVACCPALREAAMAATAFRTMIRLLQSSANCSKQHQTQGITLGWQ